MITVIITVLGLIKHKQTEVKIYFFLVLSQLFTSKAAILEF